MFRRFSTLLSAALFSATCLAGATRAAPADTPDKAAPKILRYVSLRVNKANMRQGPSYSHRILWVYRHKGYPFAVTNEFESWRKLLGPDGAEGWMSSVMLSDRRTVLITGKGRAPLYAKPGDDKVVALAEPGAVADLKACTRSDCRITGKDVDGWIAKNRIWGVGPDEIFGK